MVKIPKQGQKDPEQDLQTFKENQVISFVWN